MITARTIKQREAFAAERLPSKLKQSELHRTFNADRLRCGVTVQHAEPLSTAVLLATYNGGRYLRQQLDSLLIQTVSDFNIYAHDDGSTDETLAILKEYKRKYPERFRLIAGEPTGSAKCNFWFLLQQVEAEVYFFCDQDDIWREKKVELERDALSSKEGSAAVFSDMTVVDAGLGVIAESFLAYTGLDPALTKYTQTIIDNVAAGTTLCFNRALRDALVDAQMDLAAVEMHDGLVAAAADLLGSITYIDRPLVLYRQHAANEMGAVHEGFSQKLARNANELISGRLLERKRAFLGLSKGAAGELVKLKGISVRDAKVLRIYSHIDRMPKHKRIRFLRKNGFRRAKHTWWMYVWI